MSSARKMFAAILVGGALALSTVAGAMAHDPGNDNPDFPPGQFLPQGPKLIACENQGGALNPSGQGVFNAIDRHAENGTRPVQGTPPIHCPDGDVVED
ncbi:MAG: hypothetical protein Q8Q00_02145 [Dehalococcoidia bacterium]|nr:hypothetical protein [Dehalococcoidia bacterium]